MRITEYKFGSISVDSNVYTNDIIILPDKIINNWWREKGHSLCRNDLKDVIPYNPEIIIIGCGYYSILKVPKKLIDEFKKEGITLMPLNSKNAVDFYNSQKDISKIIFGIHLTC